MIIITGHANFATGLKSSLDLIVGDYDFIKSVDFTEDKSPDHLKEEIEKLVNQSDDNIYIFTDLAGGTPFKVSSELTLQYSNINVFCGTNLPMLIESTMVLSLNCDIDVELIKNTGINSIKPQIKKIVSEVDGI